MRTSTSDIYGILSSILVEQTKGQHPLKFSVDRKTLHCLSTDQEKAMKKLMAVNSSTVDSLPPPKPAHGKKPRRSKKAAPSDGEQFDFSPNIPGNVTLGLPTTLHIVRDSKSLIYTKMLAHENSQPICHCLCPPTVSPPLFNLLAQHPLKSNPLQVPSHMHHLNQKQIMSMVQG